MTIQLKTAVYKGVPFLFSTATTTGGPRIIKFNYPGSDEQAIEVQGTAPNSFNMTIVLPHDNYYAQRDNVLRVLRDGAAGPLVHPTFGAVPNVINGKYTLSETITELGRGTIDVTFEVDNSLGLPAEAPASPAQVDQQARVTVAQASASLADQYSVSLSFPSNLEDAIETGNNVVAALRQASKAAEPITELSSAFTREVNVLSANIGSVVQEPAELAASISSALESLNNLFETPAETLGAMSLLFTFGSDDPVYPQNTAGRVERARNRQAMRLAVRAMALSYAYTASVQVEYLTAVQLDETIDTLEAAYLGIIVESQVANETQEQLDRLRVQAQQSFDLVRVNTRALVQIETPLRPLSVLVYAYYGSTELVDTIAELNGIKQNAFVEGALQVLSE